MKRALVVALAATLAAAPVVQAHTKPVRGDVVQMIRLSRAAIWLPDVPGWHYHRKTNDGKKWVTIRPLDPKTGKHSFPQYSVGASEHGVRTPDDWLDLSNTLYEGSVIPAKGWQANGGIRCPWFEGYSKKHGPDGPRIRIVYFTSRGVAAEVWYEARTRAVFEAGLPAFEKFAAGIRIR